MTTIAQLKQTPFHKLSADEKKRVLAHTQKEAKQLDGRNAAIKGMAAEIMQKCM